MSSYTAEQEKVVVRILSHQPHQYYEILGVSKTASDGDIKKSYRKIALKLHPDKNSHPRASEAFKQLNKAWEVLGDPNKKTIFDQTGSDPTSRFGSGGSASSSGFSPGFSNGNTFHRAQGGFDEDIFNMFFGGHQPGATFSFGGNGFTFQQFGDSPFAQFQQRGPRQPPRKNQQPQPEQDIATTLKQLAPLLIFLLVTLIASAFSGDGHDYSMKPTSKFSLKRETPKYHVPFYVQPLFEKDKSASKLRRFDSKVESEYIQDKKTMCNREHMRRNQMMDEAQGWFSVDEALMNQAKAMPMPHCHELQKYGII